MLIRARWKLPSKETIHAGDLLDCVLELETIIWKLDADELDIHSEMKVDKANFAFSGKGKMIMRVKVKILFVNLLEFYSCNNVQISALSIESRALKIAIILF